MMAVLPVLLNAATPVSTIEAAFGINTKDNFVDGDVEAIFIEAALWGGLFTGALAACRNLLRKPPPNNERAKTPNPRKV